jgi:oligoendopeptidase F
MQLTADIKKAERHFVPENFAITTWEELEPYFKNLSERNIDTRDKLEQWLKDMSELEAVVSEDACWRQIKMTCDTTDKSLEESFTYFCMEIQPKLQPYADALNKKLINSPFTSELDKEKYLLTCAALKKALNFFAKLIFRCRQN